MEHRLALSLIALALPACMSVGRHTEAPDASGPEQGNAGIHELEKALATGNLNDPTGLVHDVLETALLKRLANGLALSDTGSVYRATAIYTCQYVDSFSGSFLRKHRGHYHECTGRYAD